MHLKKLELPELFKMGNGKEFSSGWLSQAIWGAFKKPLDAEPFEAEVHDYVLRRVNQGPVHDAMIKELKESAAGLEWIGTRLKEPVGDDIQTSRLQLEIMVRSMRTVLKLAQEVR